jgi:hypothetical protein
MNAADEAEHARDYLAMARAQEEDDKRPELTAGEFAAIGHAYATLALVEVMADVAAEAMALREVLTAGTAQVAEATRAQTAALAAAIRSVDGEVTSIRAAVENMGP